MDSAKDFECLPASLPRAWRKSCVGLGMLCMVAHGCAAHQPAVRPLEPNPGNSVHGRAHESLERRMHTEFAAAAQARDAIVAGKLLDARQPLIWLAAHEFQDPLPSAWEATVRRMQHAAARGAAASDLAVAANAVGAMAAACGTCHRNLQRAPFFLGDETGRTQAGPASASADVELRSRMHQHAWISRRLWEGLIGPWDGAWNAGCDELRQLRTSPSLPSTLQPRLARMQQFGEADCVAPDLAHRGAVYAKVITECGDCHAALASAHDAP